jgi:hypothetical protein
MNRANRKGIESPLRHLIRREASNGDHGSNLEPSKTDFAHEAATVRRDITALHAAWHMRKGAA